MTGVSIWSDYSQPRGSRNSASNEAVEKVSDHLATVEPAGQCEGHKDTQEATQPWAATSTLIPARAFLAVDLKRQLLPGTFESKQRGQSNKGVNALPYSNPTASAAALAAWRFPPWPEFATPVARIYRHAAQPWRWARSLFA